MFKYTNTRSHNYQPLHFLSVFKNYSANDSAVRMYVYMYVSLEFSKDTQITA